MNHDRKTIFALASAPGRAGVSVFRISGEGAKSTLSLLCEPSALPPPREATLRKIVDAKTKTTIDHALVLWFPAPNSFTGEDVVELHLHGGRAITNAVIENLRKLPNLRLAEPGEFTRRAFENGKLDLTEAEAIADLVDAETEAQRKQAMRQFEGALGSLYNGWAEDLKRCLAHSEAVIDFSDEDLPPDLEEKQISEIRKLLYAVTAHLSDNKRGEKLREGFMVAILGAPNSGKSSLLNAISEREAAIVSPIAGTTRDVIEVNLDLGGYPVTLVDTAGLRETLDIIETEGVRRALARATQADLKLLLFDGATWPAKDKATQDLADQNSIEIITKSDLCANIDSTSIRISTKTGAGLSDLVERLKQEIESRYAVTSSPALTRARHRTALEECQAHLERSLGAKEAELRAEDTRLAMRALGRITGKVAVEDLLDLIFKDFCIGK